MSYEKYESKSKLVVVLVVVILILLALLCYMYYDRYMKPNNQNDNNIVKQKDEDIDYHLPSDEPLNKEEDYDLTLSNGRFTSEQNETDYNKWLDKNRSLYEEITKKYKKIFTYGSYDIYKNTDYKNDDDYEYNTDDILNMNTEYFALNTKNKLVLETSKFANDESANLYVIYGPKGEGIIGMINLANKLVLVGYTDYGCTFHTDASQSTCKNEKITMVTKYNETTKEYKYGLISAISFRTIVPAEYDAINGLDNEYFLVNKNNKNGLMDDNGKFIIELNYDYLSYNKYIGYITIQSNQIELLNNDFHKINRNIKTVYDEAIVKHNAAAESEREKNKLFLQEANSFFWTVGSEMQYTNINKEIDLFENAYRYKYTGSTFTGEKLIINSTCYNTNSFIYVIDDNKVERINNTELKLYVDENGIQEGSYCF